MFYTETITIPAEKPSFLYRVLNRVVKAFERAGRARAAAELARMGYYEEAKKIMLQN